MLIFALVLATPIPLTDAHQRDLSCVVEVAVLADAQKRKASAGPDVQTHGRRWAGIVGDRIMFETGQPRELIAVALNEAAKARSARATDDAMVIACTRQMANELAMVDAATRPLPKPVKAQ